MENDVSLSDLLILTDGVDSTPKYGELDDVANFNDTLDSHRRITIANDVVLFDDRICMNGGTKHNVTITDTLAFTEFAHWRTWIVSWSDFLFIRDYIQNISFNRMSDTLVFADTMTGNSGTLIADALTLTDAFLYNAVLHPHPTDTLVLVDGFGIYANNQPWRPMVPFAVETP